MKFSSLFLLKYWKGFIISVNISQEMFAGMHQIRSCQDCKHFQVATNGERANEDQWYQESKGNHIKKLLQDLEIFSKTIVEYENSSTVQDMIKPDSESPKLAAAK